VVSREKIFFYFSPSPLRGRGAGVRGNALFLTPT